MLSLCSKRIVRISSIGKIGRFVSTIPNHDVQDIETKIEGERDTKEFKMFFKSKKNKELISPWHNIPYLSSSNQNNNNNIYNMVVEMPSGTTAKMEVSTEIENNPIIQDTKKGVLRYIQYGPVLYNYGMIPQTYEDPDHQYHGFPGDGDPIDVIDIGEKGLVQGQICEIKVLGALGLLDDGECDYKVIGININDALAPQLNSLEDIERLRPEVIEKIRTWYQVYKVCAGGVENAYLKDGKPFNLEETKAIIAESHQHWKNKFI